MQKPEEAIDRNRGIITLKNQNYNDATIVPVSTNIQLFIELLTVYRHKSEIK